MFEEVPDGYSSGNRDVEGVLRTALGDFEADVALVDHFLCHSFDFMAEYECVAASCLRGEFLKLDASLDLLQAAEGVALALKVGNAFIGCREILPIDRVLGSKCCLVDFGGWRTSADSAEYQPLHCKSVACAENRTYVIEAAHVVEDYGERHFRLTLEVLDVRAVEVADCFLFHESVL